jgi:hypothetical protein
MEVGKGAGFVGGTMESDHCSRQIQAEMIDWGRVCQRVAKATFMGPEAMSEVLLRRVFTDFFELPGLETIELGALHRGSFLEHEVTLFLINMAKQYAGTSAR